MERLPETARSFGKNARLHEDVLVQEDLGVDGETERGAGDGEFEKFFFAFFRREREKEERKKSLTLLLFFASVSLFLSLSPNQKQAIYLNDRYELDGRDPSGYVGCMWSICGTHDMG